MLNCIHVYCNIPGRDILDDYCSRVAFLNLTNSFINIKDAIATIQSQKVDLAFFDFDASDLHLINIVPVQTKVILLTTLLEHEIAKYTLSVNGTLRQPCSFDKFLKVVHLATNNERLTIPN